MIVKIKFVDGYTSEYDISMSCTLLDDLTNAIDKGESLTACWVNYNPVSKSVIAENSEIIIINTKNVSSVTILKFKK